MEEMECDELQIDLGYGSRAAAGGPRVEGQAGMTWLEAAEHVLREHGGPGMHIRDLTRTIMELGIAKSSRSTSLETLLYRQTSKPASKFIRVPGKMGWFGLKKTEEEKAQRKTSGRSAGSTETRTPVGGVKCTDQNTEVRPVVEKGVVSGGGRVRGEEGRGRGEEGEGNWKFNPKVVYKKKRRDGGVSVCSASASEDSEWSTSSDEESEALYHKRYIFTKKMAKSIIYENVAMAEQLKLIEQKIATAEAERQFLLDKFTKFAQRAKLAATAVNAKRPAPTAASTTAAVMTAVKTPNLTSVLTAPPLARATRGPPPLISLPQAAALSAPHVGGAAGNASCLSALLSSGGGGGGRTHDVAGGGGGQGRKVGSSSAAAPSSDTGVVVMGGQRSPNPQRVSSDSSSSSESETETTGGGGGGVLGGAEPTDNRARGGRRKVGKARRLHPIPLNDDGSPVLPIQIGGLKVYNLGKIVYDRAAYHSERYLLPLGFHSSRTYPSMFSPTRRTTYHCTILDSGDVPLFEMRAEDSEEPVQATSSTACQSIVLRAINKARDRQATNSGSGPEFFGYSNPTILNLLQKLPNAGRCSKYKFIKFESPVRAAPTVSKSRTKRKGGAGGGGRQQQRLQTKRVRLSVSPKPPAAQQPVVSVVTGGGTIPTDPSLAPVLGSGMGQLGLEGGVGLYSSSDEWSSSESERELTVDL